MTSLSKVLQRQFGLFPEVLRGQQQAVLEFLLLLLQRLVVVDQFSLEQIPFSVEPVIQIHHLRAKAGDEQEDYGEYEHS